MTKKLLLQYFFSLFGFLLLYLILVLLIWNLCNQKTWELTDPLYQILIPFKNYLPLFSIIIGLCGWAVITYHYISKPMRYLDEIVAASKKLTDPGSDTVILSDELKSVQDELNLVKDQAIRNASLAKEAEQRKNDLVVYLAHDLKTPLTSVIGYLSLLRDEPQISPQLRARYTGIALDKAEHLEDLINEFFDITRFNLTTLTLEARRVNLSRMLEQIVNEFYPVFAEKELHCQPKIAPNIEIVCDPEKLERVFDNLIRNAVNYSYDHTEIFLSLEQRNDQAEIRVQNHGSTIPPEKLEHIFEQFFRVDSSRSSSTGGAGLGLAISKEIVELHRGQIRAESFQEQTTLTVRLPLDCQKIV